jgi:hypothetical protein
VGRGVEKGRSGRGKPEDRRGLWVGFPGRFKAKQGIHRVLGCARG